MKPASKQRKPLSYHISLFLAVTLGLFIGLTVCLLIVIFFWT
jgi:hypothetical protein